MSKVFNMVGGGGGGKNISSIVITGLSSTDTVTCTKDGKSYTATWDETAQYWKIVGLPLGTFTLTATNGTKTITKTVLIDIAGVYEIEMNFKLWLYKDGDECEDVTGGWMSSNDAYVGVTKNSTYMTVTRYYKVPGYQNFVKTKNTLSQFLANNGYTKVCMEFNGLSPVSNTSFISAFVSPEYKDESGYRVNLSVNTGNNSGITIDTIPSLSEDCCVGVGVGNNGTSWPSGEQKTVNVTKAWAE